MDATPNTLAFPDRVSELYSQVERSAISKLKLIVILREPISREMSLYNHKRADFERNPDKTSWYGDVAFTNGTIKTFEQYAEYRLTNPSDIDYGKYVDHLKRWVSFFSRNQLLVLSYDELKSNPAVSQWRIQQFLGGKFAGALQEANAKDNERKKKTVPASVSQLLAPTFSRKNQDLYKFLDESPNRPWMEQYPFPHFETDGGESKAKRFAEQ